MAYGNGTRNNYNNSNGGGGRNANSQAVSNYIRSSAFTKKYVYDSDGHKEDAVLEFGVTEEVAITLTADKVAELKQKITAAENDQQGDGGIRVVLYLAHKTNKQTGEEFDGASMLVTCKFPPNSNGNNNGGAFTRGGGNRGGSGGRRDYPSQNSGGQRQTQGQHGGANAPSNNQNSGHDDRPANSQGNGQGSAKQGTRQSGQNTSGQSTGATTGGRGGHTQNAQNDASHFEQNNMQEQPAKDVQTGYSQEPGW